MVHWIDITSCRDVSWYLDPLLSRDFEQKIFDRRSLLLLSFDGFSFKLGFQFMLKVLISQISDKKLILETSTKFSQTFLRIYTNSVYYANKSFDKNKMVSKLPNLFSKCRLKCGF